MHPLISKTFGGLSFQYYFRHFLFGLIFPSVFIVVFLNGDHGSVLHFSMIFFIAISTFLYPYSRFVYEGIVDFMRGDNVFLANALFAIFIKCMTMAMCWVFAIFVAPVGLAYLYYHHSKAIS